MRTFTINSNSLSSKSFSLSLRLFGSHFPDKGTIEVQCRRLWESTAFRTCFAYFTVNPLDLIYLHAMQFVVESKEASKKERKTLKISIK